MNKNQGNLTTPTQTPPGNAARIKTIQAKTALAKAGVSRYQKRKLVEWWTTFFGDEPGDDVTVDELVETFLNPPAQWPKDWTREITKYVPVQVRDKDDPTLISNKTRVITMRPDTEADINEILDERFGKEAKGSTVRVLVYAFQNAVRGQLVFLPGEDCNHWNTSQLVDSGQVEFIKGGERYRAPLSALKLCPMPEKKRPSGPREEDIPYTVGPDGVQRKPELPPKRSTPRTIDALIADRVERFDWTATPLAYFEAIGHGCYGDLRFWGGQMLYWNVFAGLKAMADPTMKTDRGEPPLKFVGIVVPDSIFTSQQNLVPLSDEAQAWIDEELAPFMRDHPGAKTDDPNFPFPWDVKTWTANGWATSLAQSA